MIDQGADKVFAGSIPEIYDRCLVPLIFVDYADDLAQRLAGRRLASVLEVAAGTGVATRKLAAALPGSVAIVATDLNQPMIDQARKTGTSRAVDWRQADASIPAHDHEGVHVRLRVAQVERAHHADVGAITLPAGNP